MNPPKCTVCGFAHWSGAPHHAGMIVLDETPPAPTPAMAEQIIKRPRGRPISPAPKSPRAEYQRELMRKRRAAEKEAKP